MIPHFTTTDGVLTMHPLDVSEPGQTSGWRHFSFAMEQLNGSLRHLAGPRCQATAIQATISAPAQIIGHFPMYGKKLVISLGNSLAVQAGQKKPHLIHDRNAQLFEAKDLAVEFPLPGIGLLVIIDFDEITDDSLPADEMKPVAAVTMKKEALDLLGTLLFDPIVGAEPALADEISRSLWQSLLDEPYDNDPRKKTISLVDIGWFYREKAKLVQRSLLIGSTEETIRAARLDNIFRLRVLLKKCYGLTILELITESRMAEAVRQLKDPEKTIKYIAGYTGFRSTNYFTRSFRNYFGITPKRFRDMQ